MTLVGLLVLAVGGLAGLGAAAWFWGTDSRGCFDPRDHGARDPFRSG